MNVEDMQISNTDKNIVEVSFSDDESGRTDIAMILRLHKNQAHKLKGMLDETLKQEHTISKDDLSNFCRVFHKVFRNFDMKNNAEDDMYKAISKMDEEDYGVAVKVALKDALNIGVGNK